MMITAIIALGSNLGDSQLMLQEAVAQISQFSNSRIEAVAKFRKTTPVGCAPGMPAFNNSAVRLSTSLEILKLFEQLRAIEKNLGRVRTRSDMPEARTIDLDIILFGDTIVNTPELVVPHPRMHQRGFVLEPLAEIAPDMRHPILGMTMQELWRRVQMDTQAGSTPP